MSGKKKLFWSLLFLVRAALSIWAVLSQSRKWSVARLVESLRHANPLWLSMAILFTVLFVFMIVTHLRTVPVKVTTKVPQGTQLAKLVKNSSTIYVFVGKAVPGIDRKRRADAA